MEPQAFLGVMLIDEKDNSNQEQGVWISDVVVGSVAEKEGLMTGDRLVQINDQAVGTSEEVIRIVRSKKPGDKLELKYLRAGKTKKLKLELGAKEPEFPGQRWGAPDDNMRIQPFPGDAPMQDPRLYNYQFQFDGDSIMIFCPEKPNCICPNDSMKICHPFSLNQDGMEMEKKAYLGVSPAGEAVDSGVAVTVEQGTAAERMGLQNGDIILTIDGQTTNSFEEVADAIGTKNPEQNIIIELLRDGKEQRVEGPLGSRTISQFDDFRIFHDYKGQDEDGSYNYDFEFDMDKEDLQQHMEELLQDLAIRQQELDVERDDLLQELQRLQEPKEAMRITIRISEITHSDLESVNANAIPKIKSDNDLAIEQISFYPNPNEGLLNLNFTTLDKAPIKVFIYDTLGNVVYAEEVNQFIGSYKNQIDISAQPVGSYFLQIVQGQKTYSKKIAKGQ
jgi:membrane-associated protease RseP (regulator of RpoE activity)